MLLYKHSASTELTMQTLQWDNTKAEQTADKKYDKALYVFLSMQIHWN